MVDFNNETTVSTPAVDIVRVLILQRRADLMEALEDYLKKDGLGYSQSINIVKARLYTMFLEISGMLKRRAPQDYTRLETGIRGLEETEDIIKIVLEFNNILDDIGLTKIDTRKKFDSTIAELENEEKGI
jgi:hypothetical protein